MKICRDISKLHPYCQKLVELVLLECKLHNLPVEVFETIRTLDRQKEMLAAKTSKTLNSAHRLGLAVDFVFKGKKGWEFNRPKEDWDKLAKIIDSCGFYSIWINYGWDAPHGEIKFKSMTNAKLIKELDKRGNNLDLFYKEVIDPLVKKEKIKPLTK